MIKLVSALLILLSALANADGVSATQDYKKMSESEIRASLLQQIPIGTTKDDVQKRLKNLVHSKLLPLKISNPVEYFDDCNKPPNCQRRNYVDAI